MSLILCFQVTYPAPPQQASASPDELPRTVARAIHQGSTVISMDFHPSHQTLLAGKINVDNPEKLYLNIDLKFHLYV
jgi:hypothetical protein